METQPLVAKLRIVAATALLACAINQAPVKAIGFEKNPSITDMAQLATAVLTLPATLAAQANPDSKMLAGLEYTLNAVNEYMAISKQGMYFDIPWLTYDGLQIGKILSESLEKCVARKGPECDASKPSSALEASQVKQAAHSGLDENEQTKQQMKRLASVALAICRTALRMGLALKNDTAEDLQAKYNFSSRAYLCLLSSLARLADAYLHTDEDDKKAILIGLILYNAIALGVVHVAYHGDRAAYQRMCELLRPAQEKTAAQQPLNRQDVANVFEAWGVESRRELNRIYEEFPTELNIFCRTHGITSVFPQITRTSPAEEHAAFRREMVAFDDFFTRHPDRFDGLYDLHDDHIFLTNQDLRTFCNDFYTFCQEHRLRAQGSNAGAFTDQRNELEDDLALRLPRRA
jgi:hypothetical protein